MRMFCVYHTKITPSTGENARSQRPTFPLFHGDFRDKIKDPQVGRLAHEYPPAERPLCAAKALCVTAALPAPRRGRENSFRLSSDKGRCQIDDCRANKNHRGLFTTQRRTCNRSSKCSQRQNKSQTHSAFHRSIVFVVICFRQAPTRNGLLFGHGQNAFKRPFANLFIRLGHFRRRQSAIPCRQLHCMNGHILARGNRSCFLPIRHRPSRKHYGPRNKHSANHCKLRQHLQSLRNDPS